MIESFQQGTEKENTIYNDQEYSIQARRIEARASKTKCMQDQNAAKENPRQSNLKCPWIAGSIRVINMYIIK